MNGKEILVQVAIANRVSLGEVEKEISLAIHEAMNNPDPEIQAIWRELVPDGREPTPEQAVLLLADYCVRKNKLDSK